ncbi:hypothetical protein MATL_G00244510 [Megalops atlanticus]|uniref:Ras-associating domain-containing protein n=1 Tax=Megalops atlanticus TaxID=7932 RepID=A0A9D3PBV4_MEGAT|nr:hypothetical protein MATL_G00244510 [Megalops atlanticus]
MSPFGRNFLKARLKNRCESKAQEPGEEVQVWVCEEEKVVCGVTKRTTCADVVQALLEDQRAAPEDRRVLQGEAWEYCLLERWKGFERALPPLTRILRLWSDWGDQKPFVQFVLVKAGESDPASCKRSSKPKGALPKSKRWEQGPAQYMKSLPVERQKRLVRKAFRKLEKIRKERTAPRGGEEGEEGISRLVQLIISQDHTIRHQIHRMRELDLEIEQLERAVCGGRESPAPEQSESPRASLAESTAGQSAESQLQEYLCTSDSVEQMEAQLKKHRDLIEKLSREIDAEMRSVCTVGASGGGAAGEGSGAAGGGAAGDGCDAVGVELQRVRRGLERGVQRGLALQAQAVQLEGELQRSEETLSCRSRECEELAAQLSALRVTTATSHAPNLTPTHAPTHTPPHAPPHTDTTDTDSDTGISSTHSQDSLSPCMDTPPPRDTDV